MIFDSMNELVKQAMAADEDHTKNLQETATDNELVEKLAESVQDFSIEGNSRLGVAKLLVALDILSD